MATFETCTPISPSKLKPLITGLFVDESKYFNFPGAPGKSRVIECAFPSVIRLSSLVAFHNLG
jgi:hypothetical protein